MNGNFTEITALRDRWLALQPLAREIEERLWKKLRLEWNYHSNHIEGNTLSYGETELLLLHDRTTGNHSHREYLEMKAHDVGIEHVRTLAADKSCLVHEGDIRDLNRIILKEPFFKPAETAEGLPTRKEIIPGQYKTTPNNVRLPNGAVFYFASVEDTPPRMTALLDWLRQELESSVLHPVVIAAKLHHDFVVIHPFDDGNGRVARLLVNYVLMRSGYLPLIVRTDDKSNYLTALQLADAGELSALVEYFYKLTEWSLNLGIRAASGLAIEEPSDVEKELEVFVRRQQSPKERVVPLSRATITALIEESILPLLRRIELKLDKLTPLFAAHKVIYTPLVASSEIPSARAAVDALIERVPSIQGGVQLTPFGVEHQFSGYRGDAEEPFSITVGLQVIFSDFYYTVVSPALLETKKLYSEPILGTEAESIALALLADAFGQVKSQTKCADQ
jgi:Fic family protein